MTGATQIDPAFERLVAYIEASRGFDFTRYDGTSVAGQTRKRMRLLEIDTYDGYLDYLESNPAEFAQLFDAIPINVRGLFRDREAWRYLETVIVPRILDSKPRAETVRVWCPGCATGEEAYTAAVVFARALRDDAKARLRVYATDVDEEALSKARRASYTSEEVRDMPEHYQDAYFVRDGDDYAFDRELRRNVVVGRHDLVHDAPISHVDLLVCRNTLVYLNAQTQDHALANFDLALGDEGYLFLGNAELLLTRTDVFTPVSAEHRVFRRVARDELREGVRGFPPGDAHAAEPADLLHAAGFETAAQAQLVVDRDGILRLANRHARLLFSLAPSDVGRPLRDLGVSGRPVELEPMIQEAYEEGPVTARNVACNTASGTAVFEVQVTPLVSQVGEVLGAGITYLDVSSYSSLRGELERSKAALAEAYEDLQSSNQELETMNEQLQWTNRELETMNEQLQSTNDELQAMNGEFREQTTELNRVNTFLETILAGLGTSVVVLDDRFQVVALNATAEQMWGLKLEEVRDRSFVELDIGLSVDELLASFRRCLSGEGGSQVVLPSVNRRGEQISCRVQCKPISGLAGDRTGVLLLMEERPAGNGSDPA
jgi:two-component system CheB/CheR fusion protein